MTTIADYGYETFQEMLKNGEQFYIQVNYFDDNLITPIGCKIKGFKYEDALAEYNGIMHHYRNSVLGKIMVSLRRTDNHYIIKADKPGVESKENKESKSYSLKKFKKESEKKHKDMFV